ncbi:MAG: HAMP domain-containing histidine kinase [Verrucomicrobia bacterium]|nr:HAMP domain-containing histidine kinase [Verrucomicrobiota bacterium]
MKLTVPNRWLPLFGILLALLLLAGAVVHTRSLVRTEFGDQLARRDATLLAGLLEQRLKDVEEEAPDDPLLAILETASLTNLPGVMSVGLFDTNGTHVDGLPFLATDLDLAEADVQVVNSGQRVSRFEFLPNLEEEFLLPPTLDPGPRGFPVLEVILPLPDSSGEQAGMVRFLMQADSLAQEFDAMDRTLRRQALMGFMLAGLAMTVGLAFVFHRLVDTQRQLVTANRELTLAAKTAAVGAVMSHLLHGLKNPLAGLQQFVTAQATVPDPDLDWADAKDSTRRMRTMIDDVTRLLREDSGLVSYEISPSELLEHLQRRLSPLAREQKVNLELDCQCEHVLLNRTANLVTLILENLATNALQATPEGHQVVLSARQEEHWIRFRVQDEGTGLPESVRDRLFTPTLSSKDGGTGLGLALSRQLARILGAELELEKSGSEGSVFSLRISPQSEPQPITELS